MEIFESILPIFIGFEVVNLQKLSPLSFYFLEVF